MNNLKEMIVNHVGEKLKAENEVTAEMVVEVLADEFPDLLLLIAEENFFRGYAQGLVDKTSGHDEDNNTKK